MDEVWSFTHCKQINIPKHLEGNTSIGDTWTWIVIDSPTKLIPSGTSGIAPASATHFIHDLKGRLKHRVQLTSDGHKPYLEAVEDARQ